MNPEALIAQHQDVPATAMQLVCEHPASTLEHLRLACPEVALVQVISVQNDLAIDQALAIDDIVNGLLLDSGQPDQVIPELGGTGRVHDWRISRAIVEACVSPVWLAGGLSAENVAGAIEQVRPHGVDVCSSVRIDDPLDPVKLRRLIRAVQQSA